MTRNGPAMSSGLTALRMTRGRCVIFRLGTIGAPAAAHEDGPDVKIFEYFISMGDMPEMKAMEITYTRVK